MAALLKIIRISAGGALRAITHPLHQRLSIGWQVTGHLCCVVQLIFKKADGLGTRLIADSGL
jgi:hypothetical protein